MTDQTLFIRVVVALLLVFSTFGYVESAPVQNASISNLNATSEFEPAWVSGPQRRGTLIVIFSCVLTLLLCVWTTVHSNIEPEPELEIYGPQTEGKKPKTWHGGEGLYKMKFMWSIATLLFPEISLCIAAHERKTAQLLCKEMRALTGHDHWDLTLAYYAVMGGFVLERPSNGTEDRRISANSEDGKLHLQESRDVIFPNQNRDSEGAEKVVSYLDERFSHRRTLTPCGVLRLAKLGKIPETYTSKMVKDKSKVSTLAKVLVCFQAIWIIIQVAGRYASGLPVTLLELYTVLHTICAVVMYGAWMHKPFDINQPTSVEINHHDLSELLKMDSADPNPTNIFRNHDYIDCLTQRAGLGKLLFRQLWDWNQPKSNGTFIDTFQLLLGAYLALWNGWQKFGWEAFALSIIGLVYGGLHLAVWNYNFPTSLERTWWIVSSIISAGAVSIFCFAVLIGFLGMLIWNWAEKKMEAAEDRAQHVAMKTVTPGSETVEETLSQSVILWNKLKKWLDKSRQTVIMWCMFFFCFSFMLLLLPSVVSRLYLLVESFVAMRKLPVGSYDVVVWSAFLPHFG